MSRFVNTMLYPCLSLFNDSNCYKFVDYWRVCVCYCLFMTFYDVPAMIHLTMVIMLSSRRIRACHNRYRRFFSLALGKEWSTIIAITIRLAWRCSNYNRKYGRLKFLFGRFHKRLSDLSKLFSGTVFRSSNKTITYVWKINLKNNTRYVKEVRF